MSRAAIWLYRCCLLTIALSVGVSSSGVFLRGVRAQNLSQNDLTQPELRQTRLRQAVRLGLQAEYAQMRALVAPLRVVAEQRTDKGTMAAALMAETLALALQNKPLEALATYRKLPSLTEFENDRRAQIYVLGLRAFLGYYRNDFKQVRADAERALRLCDPAAEQFEMAFTLNALSLAQLAEQQLEDADKTLQQSLALCEQASEPMLKAVALNNLGLLNQYRAEQAVALKHFNASLALCRQHNLRTVLHYVLKNSGDAALQLNQNQPALDYYQQSLRERQNQGNSAELATVWANIANAYLALNQYQEAIQAREKCLAIEQALKLPEAEATAALFIGNIYLRQEDFRRAFEALQKSLSLAAARQDNSLQGRAALRISHLLLRQNNPALAREYMLKALQLTESSQDPRLLGDACLSASMFHHILGEHRAALPFYDKLLHQPRLSKDLRQRLDAWFGKAATHLELGEYDLAENALRAGEKLNENIQFPFELFYASYWWSRLEAARGQYQAALTHAQRAAAQADQLGQQEIKLLAYTQMGSLLRRKGQFDAAAVALKQAIAAHEWLLTQTIGDTSQQAFSFTRALSPYHEMVRLLVSQHKPEEALAFAERAKGRALLDVLQHGKDDLSHSLTAAERAEEQVHETALRSLNLELSALRGSARANPARLATLEQQLQQARLALEGVQTRLYAAHPRLKTQRGELPLFNAREVGTLAHREPTAFLEYVVTDEQTFLFVLTPESAQVHVAEIPLPRAQLAQRVGQWRKQLAERDPAFRAPARQLAELLLGPARAHLQGKLRLLLVPDDALWELPFQALLTRVETGERFLLEEYAISYAPSLTVLREMMRVRDQRPRKAEAAMLAFGNPALPNALLAHAQPAYRERWLAPLPEAEREVKTLAQLYGAASSKVFIGAAAHEAQAKTEASNYDILHFATHGILNDASPLYSHLLLAPGDAHEDGLLEAREVLKLDLRAELVTLSACETARGKLSTGEGVIGLSWAFFVAGSPATLVSQWKVESASTSSLMRGFYQQLRNVRSGSKAAALRQAALRLMQSPDYKHPFYWAGFVLIGDSR